MRKIDLRYVLLLLCVIFGVLYLALGEHRDITANLFVAMIVVLVLDQIVKRSELQRKERSISYVKRRITSVYTDLIWRMWPPKNWRALEDPHINKSLRIEEETT